jgi:hypothetical protein
VDRANIRVGDPIFKPSNIHIVWIRSIDGAGVLYCVALAIFCTISFSSFENFFWKHISSGKPKGICYSRASFAEEKCPYFSPHTFQQLARR